MEVSFGSTGLLDVESCESNCGTGHVKKNDQPVPAFLVQYGEIHDHRRSETKRDYVNKRVELGAEAGSAACRSSNASVECVCNAAEHNQESCLIELSARRADNCKDSTE